MVGRRLLHFHILAKLGEGDPPSLRVSRAERRRGRAV